jgi:hypothetical protein
MEENTIYVIDTSGLIKLESTFNYDNPVFSAIWEEIEELIQLNQFKTIDFVEEEINQYEGEKDFLKKWVKRRKKQFVLETDIASFNASRPIINAEYSTGFLDQKKQAQGKEEADPYLIGFCLTHNYVLITNENFTKPNKIPGVSRKYGVRCINIEMFLEERGMKMTRKNK